MAKPWGTEPLGPAALPRVCRVQRAGRAPGQSKGFLKGQDEGPAAASAETGLKVAEEGLAPLVLVIHKHPWPP